MILKEYINNIALFTLFVFSLINIAGCNSNVENETVLVESGIYNECQPFNTNKFVKVNGKEKEPVGYTECSNSLVTIYNPKSDRYKDKLIIFFSGFVNQEKSMTLQHFGMTGQM